MVIGNGLLARSLMKYDSEEIVFIAAGVSDSKCTEASEFERERRLVEGLVRAYPDKIMIFFSTFSINDPVMQSNPYVKSKIGLEQYLVSHCSKYLIIRISNLVGEGGNPKTIFNFFFSQIISGNRFSLWANSRRNLIMVDDFARVLGYILEYEIQDKMNTIFNIINTKSFSVHEIVKAIERHTGRKAKYDIVEIQSVPQPVDEYSEKIFNLLNIDTTDYLAGMLEKYFSKHKVV